ncbi:MAG: sigma-70 family RNA polymerase sigma factor [Clostridia bacterium]|nr:sigma-70 family RNA polymerase sigma factor [Clostridia bacterium]
MYENKNTLIIKAAKDKNAMEILLEENVGLIWSIIKRFIGKGYEIDDLYQIGCIGFIKAIKRFDFGFGVKLSTYAIPYIVGEIKKFIRDDGIIKVSRNIKELGIKIREIEREYFIKYGEYISTKELSKILCVSEDEIFLTLDALQKPESINLDNQNDNNKNIIEKISSGQDEQANLIDKLAISELVEALNERDRKIIKLRFYKEKTQTQVAKIIGISQVQVSRIEKRILNDFKRKLSV